MINKFSVRSVSHALVTAAKTSRHALQVITDITEVNTAAEGIRWDA